MGVTEEVLVGIYIPVPPEKGDGWYPVAEGRMKIKVDDRLDRDVAKNCLKGFLEYFWAPNPAAAKPYVPKMVIAGATIPGCGLIYVNGTGEEMGMSMREGTWVTAKNTPKFRKVAKSVPILRVPAAYHWMNSWRKCA